MGNHSATGHVMNTCGCTDALGFETSAEAVISMNGIQAWKAKDLVKGRLKVQHDLANHCRLKEIPVVEGVRYLGQSNNNWWSQNVDSRLTSMVGLSGAELTRETFATACWNMLAARNLRPDGRDRDDFYRVFDSMDFDGNGTLSVGEWAGGVTVFFKGSQEDCVHAVFEALDRDGSRSLSKAELQQYLSPFVKAMSPKEAESLRPLLLKKATDDIYNEMDMDRNNQISSDELLEWTYKGNNIVDRLAGIIDHEVYHIWLRQSDSHHGYNANQGYNALMTDGPYGTGTYMPGQQNRGGQYGSNPPYSQGGGSYDAMGRGSPTDRGMFSGGNGGAGAIGCGGQRNYGERPGYNNLGLGNDMAPYGQGPSHGGSPYPYDARNASANSTRSMDPNNNGGFSAFVAGVADMFGGTDSKQYQGPPRADGGYNNPAAYNAQYNANAGYSPRCNANAGYSPQYNANAGYSHGQAWSGDHRHVPPPPPPPPRSPRGSYGNQAQQGNYGYGGRQQGIPGYGGNYGY